jgi:hypothetical protein
MSSIDVIARGSKHNSLNLNCAYLVLCDLTVPCTSRLSVSKFHSRRLIHSRLMQPELLGEILYHVTDHPESAVRIRNRRKQLTSTSRPHERKLAPHDIPSPLTLCSSWSQAIDRMLSSTRAAGRLALRGTPPPSVPVRRQESSP